MNGDFKPSKLFDHANRMIEAYHSALSPLCKETGMPPLALDVLLFVANNPQSATANEICRLRGFKAGIVSVHIERLVTGGLLERKSVPNDRRKTMLAYTEKASGIVKKGQELQAAFAKKLLSGLSEDDLNALRRATEAIDKNVEEIRKNGLFPENSD